MLALFRMGIAGAAAGALLAAVVYCAVALSRDITGHEWYSAGKLTIAQLRIKAGFDEFAPVEYRNAEGVVETMSRFDLTVRWETRMARARILHTAREAAQIGGYCGVAGAAACMMLALWLGWWDNRPRGSAPASGRRRQFQPESGFPFPHDSPNPSRPPPSSAKKPRKKRRRHHGRWA